MLEILTLLGRFEEFRPRNMFRAIYYMHQCLCFESFSKALWTRGVTIRTGT